MSQDIGEILFIENNYDESLKFINQAIKFYENHKIQLNNNNSKSQKYQCNPRWISLQYIKACIEVKRNDIDKGFQTLNKYPIQIQNVEKSQSISLKQDEENIISQKKNNVEQYWGTRLQTEIFLKLGQIELAYSNANIALNCAQTIQDVNILNNTLDLQKDIQSQIQNKQLCNNQNEHNQLKQVL